jgi:peptide/nickel transport system ATP-binding protein/oligopeptide transport system ATP-binding protein
MMSDEILIDVRGLQKHFPIRGGLMGSTGTIKAVDGVNIYIRKGETLGLVGESGCGKTTTGRCILHLTKPTGGNIYWKMPADIRSKLIELEAELAKLPEGNGRRKSPEQKRIEGEIDEIRKRYSLEKQPSESLRMMRKNMQIVFQDPYSSLSPRMLIKDIVSEPLLIHGIMKGEELKEYVRSLIETVGLNPEHLYRYPHEFSGGQRQRIGVARALALNPELVVLDEPTSALDVSVQAQILNMLNDLQSRFGLTYLFISHDLSSVRYMCDRVAVMYLGKIVELAPKTELFERPLHPYTEALLSVIPIPDPKAQKNKLTLSGEIPSPANPPSGCRFHTRCKYREERCEREEPPLMDIGGEHLVACHRASAK